MHFLSTTIPDVMIIERDELHDERGFFTEIYHAGRFGDAGIFPSFVQENMSRSYNGILRGLHYQIHRAQGKLVGVLSGEIFDVAIDLRKSSRYFGKWVGVRLTAANGRQLWIPPGFAHGFYVMSEVADIRYLATELYSPEWERTILWKDPDIDIRWPLTNSRHPMLSTKDKNGLQFAQAEIYE